MRLNADEVHVWVTDPGALAPERLRLCRRLLCSDELERLSRFVFEKDRLLYLTSHAQIRRVLSLYEKIEPQNWRFRANRYGRPEIAEGGNGLRFNISHTEGLVVSAVARDVEVGIDVENSTSREAAMEVAETVFAPAEYSALQLLKGESRPRRFFKLWTLKEAYVKARGMGLSIPLRRFAFDLSDPVRITVQFDPELNDEPQRWQFRTFRPTGDHQMSLAILKGEEEEKKITVRRFAP